MRLRPCSYCIVPGIFHLWSRGSFIDESFRIQMRNEKWHCGVRSHRHPGQPLSRSWLHWWSGEEMSVSSLQCTTYTAMNYSGERRVPRSHCHSLHQPLSRLQADFWGWLHFLSVRNSRSSGCRETRAEMETNYRLGTRDSIKVLCNFRIQFQKWQRFIHVRCIICMAYLFFVAIGYKMFHDNPSSWCDLNLNVRLWTIAASSPIALFFFQCLSLVQPSCPVLHGYLSQRLPQLFGINRLSSQANDEPEAHAVSSEEAVSGILWR